MGTGASWALVGQFEKKKSGIVNSKDQYLSRKNLLMNNRLVIILARELRMKEAVLVAIIQLMNGEADFNDDSDIIDELVLFLGNALNIREEAKINEIKPMLQILMA